MSYIKRADIPALEGETVVELDAGDLVAVSCIRKRVDLGLGYHAVARVISEAAAPVNDARGQPIRSEYKCSVEMEKVEEHTDGAITREMLLAVLGEPVTLFPWPQWGLDDASIRKAIAAAEYSGAADAGAAL